MSNNPFGLAESSPLSNNPFAANSAASRFPAVDPSGSSSLSPIGGNAGYGYQQQQQQQQPQQTGFYGGQQPSYGQQQQQQPAYGGPQLSAQPTGFQPQSAFGQSIGAGQPSFPQQQPTGNFGQYGAGGPSSSSFGNPSYASQQASASNPSYSAVADLDPYSSLAHLPWAQPASVPAPPQSPTSGSSSQPASWNEDHPRSYVRNHKSELETWRPDAWREFNRCVDKLKEAWVGRKQLVIKAMEGYGTQWDPADAQRVRDLMHEADQNIDMIVAASFQLKEAEAGYRHSSDSASRMRVRESLNAGLNALPEWPEPLQTTRGQTIGFGAQAQPPVQMLQTGYGGGGGQGFGGGQSFGGGQQQQQPQYGQQPSFAQGYPQQQPQQPQFTGWGGAPGFQQQQSFNSGYGRQW